MWGSCASTGTIIVGDLKKNTCTIRIVSLFDFSATTTLDIIYYPNSLLVKKSESISLILFQRSQLLSIVKKLYVTLHTLTVNISTGSCFSDHIEHLISGYTDNYV